jgi:hypothetical protein
MFGIARLLRVMSLAIALLAAVAIPAIAEPPALFYSLLPLKHDQKTCMNRAYAAVATEVSGKISKRSDNISLVNDDFNIGVHCRSTGRNTSFSTIVVAHRTSFVEAKGVALNIRSGMKTGIFE